MQHHEALAAIAASALVWLMLYALTITQGLHPFVSAGVPAILCLVLYWWAGYWEDSYDA